MKDIVIGCDNLAVDFKNQIIRLLEQRGINYEDVGVGSSSDDKIYPSVAKEVAERIINSGYKKEGILICGTGIGMAITANKFPGIYAAVCHDIYSVVRSRLSNNTNVIAMGARVIGIEHAKVLMAEWLNLSFIPGDSTPKINMLSEIEKENFKSVDEIRRSLD